MKANLWLWLLDRKWPARETEWPQDALHAYARMMGINPDPPAPLFHLKPSS